MIGKIITGSVDRIEGDRVIVITDSGHKFDCYKYGLPFRIKETDRAVSTDGGLLWEIQEQETKDRKARITRLSNELWEDK